MTSYNYSYQRPANHNEPILPPYPGPPSVSETDALLGHSARSQINKDGRRPLSKFIILGVIGVIIVLNIVHVSYDYKNTRKIREEGLRREKAIQEERLRLSLREKAIQEESLRLSRREKAIREKEAAMELDEERRKKTALAWVDVTPMQKCESFNSREYRAELKNVPMHVDGMKWCMETSIVIHNMTYTHPTWCSRESGSIIGHWTATSNEPTCRTYWAPPDTKECVGTKKRRVESKLENHQPPWDNWREMCASTPWHFSYGHYDSPDTCRDTNHDGIFGAWFVHDETCP